MKKALGFTLAEVLITLAIIGVVAALTIPSVIANTQQQEFKTGLKKAVSVLNSAITMNMAIEGESPYDNRELYEFLSRHMSVMKSKAFSPAEGGRAYSNYSFYTTDGMRFEFGFTTLPLHEDSSIRTRGATNASSRDDDGNYIMKCAHTNDDKEAGQCSHCGSYGLKNNPDNTIYAPCYIVVDVNGDRKPFPQNASCIIDDADKRNQALDGNFDCAKNNIRKYSDPNGKKLTDTFGILITDKQAIPYGVAAQKAMYESQK